MVMMRMEGDGVETRNVGVGGGGVVKDGASMVVGYCDVEEL